VGLEAVAQLDLDDMKQADDLAIQATQFKYAK